MSKKIRVVKHYSGVNSGVGADSTASSFQRAFALQC